MARPTNNFTSPIYGIEFEYQMPHALAQALFTGEGKRISDRQQFLVDYVNRELGLRGHCTRVIVV